jgi:hypothetical protein
VLSEVGTTGRTNLIGVEPATCVLVGRVAGAVSRPFLLGVVVAVAASPSVTGAEVAIAATHGGPSGTSEVGSLSAWLDAARCLGDSAVVLYGEASVFEMTKLRPACPYLWTLPQRIPDPHLTHLVHTLDRRRAPTFVVVRSSLDSWRQDPHGRLRGILDRRYRLVADIGGDSVYLQRGEPPSTTGARLCTRAASGADTPVLRHPAQRNPQVEPTARTRSRHQVGSYRAGHPPR